MSDELPEVPPQLLSSLADWAVSQGKGKTLFQLQVDVRDAINSGHPLLAGAVFCRLKGRKIAEAVFAASERQFKAIKENHERKMDALLSEAVKTPAQLNTSAIAAKRAVFEGPVENHLEKLNKTACSRCRSRQLVLWSNDTEQLCENCFDPESPQPHPDSTNFHVLFCPHMLPNGTWVSKPTTSFSVLREFIEKCMRPTTATNMGELLVLSSRAMNALIDLLESKIILPNKNPAFVARAEKIKSLRQSIQRPHEELSALNHTIHELERKMSQEAMDVPARKILKKERGVMRSRAAAKRVEVENIARQIKSLKTETASFLETHPSRIQKHAVERLRRDFTQWQKGELDFEFKTPIHHVYWELLKPSGNSWEELVRHYEYLQRTRNERYELERLKQIHDLGPERIYIGLASFEGYVVFSFPAGEVAVLDCPQVGNALYVMTTDKWKFLSQLSKTELLHHHQHEVQRIIHGWHWFHELKSLLEDRGVLS